MNNEYLNSLGNFKCYTTFVFYKILSSLRVWSLNLRRFWVVFSSYNLLLFEEALALFESSCYFFTFSLPCNASQSSTIVQVLIYLFFSKNPNINNILVCPYHNPKFLPPSSCINPTHVAYSSSCVNIAHVASSSCVNLTHVKSSSYVDPKIVASSTIILNPKGKN
jgi:hypothetical protein